MSELLHNFKKNLTVQMVVKNSEDAETAKAKLEEETGEELDANTLKIINESFLPESKQASIAKYFQELSQRTVISNIPISQKEREEILPRHNLKECDV